MTTSQTIAKPQSKSGSYFSSLIDESYQKVYNMAYRLSGNRQDAEDLTQEACYRAFRSFDDFEGDKPFTNWIYRIVTRLYLDLRRNRSRRVSEVSLDAPMGSMGDHELRMEPADTRPNPETELISGVICEELQSALDTLTPEQLRLVQMADVNAMDSADIAVKISTPNGTVRSRLHRAHHQMRNHLNGGSAPRQSPKTRSDRKSTLTPIGKLEVPASTSNWMTTPFIRLAEKFG